METETSTNIYTNIFSTGSETGRSSPASSTSTSDVSIEDDPLGLEFLLNKRLILTPDATLSKLQEDISMCMELITESDEYSSERKWLVRHLIELRIRVQQLEDYDENLPIPDYVTMGHHFELQKITTRKQNCDACSSVIWNILQGSYVCKDCNYKCHLKCISNINRNCAHLTVREGGELSMTICPERGLDAQQYKCAECKTTLGYVPQYHWVEPRLCDYSGLYFCSLCHWNNVCEIPARVIHNWDWEKRQVSQSAYQLLTLTKNVNLINVDESNEKLFSHITNLELVRRIRIDLNIMKKYLVECKTGNQLITRELMDLAENPKMYSMAILESARNSLFIENISILFENCRLHITQCQTCYGKGYLCELCGNDEPIFPFDLSAVGCSRCNSYFHQNCWTQKNQTCPKCARIKLQNLSRESDEEA